MTVGKEWLVDALGCDASVLAESGRLLELCAQIIGDLDLHVVGSPALHQFPSGGLTLFYLLTESHLACHTYPELGIATFNLYCCRERADWNWRQELTRALSADTVTITKVTRGADYTANPASDPKQRFGTESLEVSK
jgi:S-adenosylmethionine decarboxylase